MLDLSPTKLLIIFVVVVILLGPKRLPAVARQLGAAWGKLRQFHQQVDRELRQSIPDLPSSADIVRFARSPVTLLNHLADRPDGDAARPGSVQPGSVEPGSVQPGPPGQPGSVQPGSVQPGSVQPGSVQPGPVQPGPPGQPGSADTGPLPPGRASGLAPAATRAVRLPDDDPNMN